MQVVMMKHPVSIFRMYEDTPLITGVKPLNPGCESVSDHHPPLAL